MIYRDPRCVYVAGNVAEGSVVVNWLEHQGIPARVMDTATFGGLEGLNAWTGSSARGIEIWVLQEDLIDQAKKLLAEHDGFETEDNAEEEAPLPPVSAQCEDCGRTTVFPGERRGKIGDCPHCGSYIDVPEEGNEPHEERDGPGAVPTEPPPRSWGRRVSKVFIWVFIGSLFFRLFSGPIAAILSMLSRLWER